MRQIDTRADARLQVISEMIAVPRARLAAAHRGDRDGAAAPAARVQPTNINFKTFLPLLIQQKLSPEFPSHYAQSYLHDKALGNDDLTKRDAENRASVEAYLQTSRRWNSSRG